MYIAISTIFCIYGAADIIYFGGQSMHNIEPSSHVAQWPTQGG